MSIPPHNFTFKNLRTRIAVVLTIFLIFAFVNGWLAINEAKKSSLLVFMFAAGALGAACNSYRRLLQIKESDLTENYLRLETQIVLSPLIGGIFAVMVFFISATEALGSKIFPKFNHLEAQYDSMHLFFSAIGPDTHRDAAKLLFLAFAAGFSEQFLPNVIDRLVKKADA